MSDRPTEEENVALLKATLEQAQEVAHIGSWIAELDGSNRIEWSAESHRIFGVPPGKFEGTVDAFYACLHPDDRDAVRAASRAAVEGGVPYDIEHRVLRPDGTVRWVHEQANILRDAQGRPRRMIGTVQDVTDRRQLEDQLRQAQKMEAMGRLAGGIAHDLNNALTAIAGYAQLALGQLDAEHSARADVEEIRREAERAGSVTGQLLAFSRKQLFEPRIFDVNTDDHGDRAAALAAARHRRPHPDPPCRHGAHGARRSGPGGAGRDQPRRQRPRRDAGRRSARPDHGHGNRGRAVRAHACADARRVLCGDERDRYRARHVTRHAGPDLRAVLHDEGGRQGDRARAVDGLRHAEADRRVHLRRQRDRPRHDVPPVFSPGRPEGGGSATQRPCPRATSIPAETRRC